MMMTVVWEGGTHCLPEHGCSGNQPIKEEEKKKKRGGGGGGGGRKRPGLLRPAACIPGILPVLPVPCPFLCAAPRGEQVNSPER